MFFTFLYQTTGLRVSLHFLPSGVGWVLCQHLHLQGFAADQKILHQKEPHAMASLGRKTNQFCRRRMFSKPPKLLNLFPLNRFVFMPATPAACQNTEPSIPARGKIQTLDSKLPPDGTAKRLARIADAGITTVPDMSQNHMQFQCCFQESEGQATIALLL